MKNFIAISDFSVEELERVIEDSLEIKRRFKDENYKPMRGKILGMLFEKSSTRTRLSFEVGMKRLGGEAIFLSSRDIQLGRGESIGDTARVMSRYVDAIMVRTFEHARIVEFAENATVPVINGLTDLLHPCQVVSDLVTIREHFGHMNVKIAFVGDGNNMANSWVLAAGVLGLRLSVATPLDLSPSGVVLQRAFEFAKASGASIVLTESPEEAVMDAQVVYTDTWVSMGDEAEATKKKNLLAGFQVNSELVAYAAKDYIFMHCLPAHRGEEVTDEIMDSDHSAVFTQAENRVYAQMAILNKLFEEI